MKKLILIIIVALSLSGCKVFKKDSCDCPRFSQQVPQQEIALLNE